LAKRIDAACKKVGVKYEFLREEYGFTVRFHRHCGEGWNQTKNQDVSGTRPEKRPNKRPDQQTKIEERANRVLELLTNAPAISRPAICEKLHLSDRQVRTAIVFLKANGKIHREGPAKGGKWIVD
jgi:predicted HTH transcriptional regulator